MGFTDSNGRSHNVDCEVYSTGMLMFLLQGPPRTLIKLSLMQLYWLMRDILDFFTLRDVYFGNAVAVSIAVNVLN